MADSTTITRVSDSLQRLRKHRTRISNALEEIALASDDASARALTFSLAVDHDGLGAVGWLLGLSPERRAQVWRELRVDPDLEADTERWIARIVASDRLSTALSHVLPAAFASRDPTRRVLLLGADHDPVWIEALRAALLRDGIHTIDARKTKGTVAARLALVPVHHGELTDAQWDLLAVISEQQRDAPLLLVPLVVGAPPRRFPSLLAHCEPIALPVTGWSSSESAALRVIAKSSSDPGGVAPYPGFESFDEQTARWYFGRDRDLFETRALLQRAPRAQWLSVDALSGTGKSSFVRAALVPSIEMGLLGGRAPWRTVVLRPLREPAAALLRALEEVLDHAGGHHSFTSEAPLDVTAFSGWLGTSLGEHRLLVVVDQLEELSTLARDPGQRGLFDTVLDAVLALGERVLLVTAIRSDFLSTIELLPRVGARRGDAVRLALRPLDGVDLLQAVEAPCRLAGRNFEAGLVARIVSDAARVDLPLPLVAQAMRALWVRDRARTDGILSHEGYDALNGIVGALAEGAEVLLQDLGVEGEALCRRVLLRLVRAGRGSADTRRPLAVNELLRGLDGGASDLVERLLGRAHDTHGIRVLAELDGQIEIAHETLLTRWRRLHEWIEAARGNLEARDEVEEQGRQWVRAGRPLDDLPAGPLLQLFLEAPHDELSEVARAFLRAATNAATREQARRSRDEARQRHATRYLAVSTVIAVGIAVLAFQQWRVAENSRVRVTDSLARLHAELADKVQNSAELGEMLVASDPWTALLVALDGVAVAESEHLPDRVPRLLGVAVRACGVLLGNGEPRRVTELVVSDWRRAAVRFSHPRSSGRGEEVSLWNVQDNALARINQTTIRGASEGPILLPGGRYAITHGEARLHRNTLVLWDLDATATSQLSEGLNPRWNDFEIYADGSIAVEPEGEPGHEPERYLASSIDALRESWNLPLLPWHGPPPARLIPGGTLPEPPLSRVVMAPHEIQIPEGLQGPLRLSLDGRWLLAWSAPPPAPLSRIALEGAAGAAVLVNDRVADACVSSVGDALVVAAVGQTILPIDLTGPSHRIPVRAHHAMVSALWCSRNRPEVWSIGGDGFLRRWLLPGLDPAGLWWLPPLAGLDDGGWHARSMSATARARALRLPGATSDDHIDALAARTGNASSPSYNDALTLACAVARCSTRQPTIAARHLCERFPTHTAPWVDTVVTPREEL